MRNAVADDLVGLLSDERDRLAGADGNRDDDPACAAGAQSAHRRQVGEAGRQPVVDDDDRAPAHVDRRTAVAIRGHPAPELAHLALDGGVEQPLGHSDPPGDLGVQDGGAVLGDRADAELGVAGCAQLANRQDVQRRLERSRDLDGDRDASARQRDHDRPLRPQRRDLRGEQPTGVAAIAEHHAPILAPV